MKDFQEIKYSELDSDFQQQVKKDFLSGELSIPQQWYNDIVEDLIEKYENHIHIDDVQTTFNIKTKEFNFEGSVYVDSEEMSEIIPDKFYEYDTEKQWLSFIDNNFFNGKMNRNLELDEFKITESIEKSIFPDSSIEANQFNISEFRPLVEKALFTYKNQSKEILSIFENWILLMDTSEQLFFQQYVEIKEQDYDYIIRELSKITENEIKKFINDEFYDKLDDFIKKVSKEFETALKKGQKQFFSKTNIETFLMDKSFLADVDKNGNITGVFGYDIW